MRKDAAKVECLSGGDGDRDEDGLDDGAAVADEPEEFLAVEGFFAEGSVAAWAAGGCGVGCEAAAEPLVCGPDAEPYGGG
jgi:hypothetical protein